MDEMENAVRISSRSCSFFRSLEKVLLLDFQHFPLLVLIYFQILIYAQVEILMLQQAPHENSHLIDLYKLLKECFVIIDPNSSFNNLTHFIILYLTQIWFHICAFFLSILKKKEIFYNSIFDTNLTPFLLVFSLYSKKRKEKEILFIIT